MGLCQTNEGGGKSLRTSGLRVTCRQCRHEMQATGTLQPSSLVAGGQEYLGAHGTSISSTYQS